MMPKVHTSNGMYVLWSFHGTHTCKDGNVKRCLVQF